MTPAPEQPSNDALLTALARHLPRDQFGALRSATPISIGLSGAAVYAVSTESGDFVLRVSPPHEAATFARQLAMLRLASQHGIAPRLAHVDDVELATVSARIVGPHIGVVLTDPATRDRAIASLVRQLVALHALSGEGIEHLDPLALARSLLPLQSGRPGLPAWVPELSEPLERCAEIVARDPRRVLSHNDVNPGNLLWDGARIWLVDWSASGMMHPYYDLATFSMFLQIPEEGALALLAAQEGVPINAEQTETFRALRRLAAINCGLMFMTMTPDDALSSAPERVEDAPTLAQCYGLMRTGALDLQSGAGQCTFGLALLRVALD